MPVSGFTYTIFGSSAKLSLKGPTYQKWSFGGEGRDLDDTARNSHIFELPSEVTVDFACGPVQTHGKKCVIANDTGSHCKK